MKPRAWLLAAAAVLLVLLVAHGALWWIAERRVATGVEEWRAALASQGWQMQAGAPEYAGWPLAATRVYPEVTLSAGALRLRTAQLAVSVSPLHAGTVWLTAPDSLAIDLPELPPLRLVAPDGVLAAPLQGAPFVTFDAKNFTAEADPPDGPARVLTTGLAHLRLDPGLSGTKASLSAQSITLPEPLAGETYPLGPRLASVSFDATLGGAIDPGRLDAATLAAWRDAGGSLLVERLALGYGPLGLSARGQFGLDGALQPSGQADLQIIGYAQTVQALVASHALTAPAGRAVDALLSLLAHTPEGGGVPEVDTKLTLQNRVLAVAGYDLVRLPELRWPAGS